MDIRRVESYTDFRSCVTLQEMTWGASNRETVPAHLLSIAAKVGGLVAGAFDGSGEMLGFVFSLTGHREGERIQWSHMLAVRSDARDLGIGRALKLFQREAALEEGIETIYWTFDPLVARNAHLNLNRLGARIAEFRRDMYGMPDDDSIYAPWGTDRFVVRWDLASEGVARAIHGHGEPTATPHPLAADLEIPWDVVALASEDPARVLGFRDGFRAAAARGPGFERCVLGLVRDPEGRRCWYRVDPALAEAEER